MRLIDADKIVEVAEHAYGEWNLAMATQDTTLGVNRVFKMQELCKAVKGVADGCPTIDPESLRPHGNWILLPPTVPFEIYKCSLCGQEILYAMQNYCPCCGAKMNEGENDGS